MSLIFSYLVVFQNIKFKSAYNLNAKIVKILEVCK